MYESQANSVQTSSNTIKLPEVETLITASIEEERVAKFAIGSENIGNFIRNSTMMRAGDVSSDMI